MELIVSLILALLILCAFAAIFRKAGFSGWLGLLMLIPVVNLIWLLAFAFMSEWPIHRQLARAQSGAPADVAK